MTTASWLVLLCVLVVCSSVSAEGGGAWLNPRWRYRTTVTRPTPYRDETPRPVEVAVDFPLLLERGGVSGQFDPGSLRVVERHDVW